MESTGRPAEAGSGMLADYDYELPADLIAQHPLGRRDASRLMLVRAGGGVEHRAFADLPALLRPGDLLVLNDTRVNPARLRFRWRDADAEILLLRPIGGDSDLWAALLRPGKKVVPGTRLQIRPALWADVMAREVGGLFHLHFWPPRRLSELLEEIGEMPLPPYIREPLVDPDRYQTVYARNSGSAAAPTAGLHFTFEMLHRLVDAGIESAPLTLTIGLDTFQPIRVEELSAHRMHSESYVIPSRTRGAIEATRSRGGRVVAVGTTVARALEAAADRRAIGDLVGANLGDTDIFIRPGYQFREVDLLLTNFHLPKSTLLVMVAAFAGRERVLAAYTEAIERGYRFYSFGDAMLLEPA